MIRPQTYRVITSRQSYTWEHYLSRNNIQNTNYVFLKKNHKIVVKKNEMIEDFFFFFGKGNIKHNLHVVLDNFFSSLLFLFLLWLFLLYMMFGKWWFVGIMDTSYYARLKIMMILACRRNWNFASNLHAQQFNISMLICSWIRLVCWISIYIRVIRNNNRSTFMVLKTGPDCNQETSTNSGR